MSTVNFCCGVRPQRIRTKRTYWLRCACCGRVGVGRNFTAALTDWHSVESLTPENIPAYINQESAISVFKGVHHA